MIEQLIPRRKFRIQSKEFGDQWQTISYQKKASDVELEGGETVQHRIDNLVAKITELSNVIRNFKTQEGTDHDAFKRRIGLLYEQIRSGIGGVYNTFLTIEAEGEGAEDYNRLSGEFNTFQNQTRTKLTQLEADVEELLSYEPDAEGNVEQIDAYDYLDKLIDELEEYMSLVLTQLAQVIGDGDITDVLLNANVDITDQTDTSLAAALKIQHGKISGLETMMNQMGVGNPPYTWERYEYSSSDDPATCPVKVTAMTNTGDTTTYVPVWRVVFFYQPVFKLLKMTGYMGVSGTGTLDRSVYLSMDVETNKLRFFYTLLDNYERYQWINQDENGVISTVLDQYIDPRQGLLRNGYDTTTVLRVEQWSGLTLPSYYNFNYLGISMGDTGDTAYNPSGFSVWNSGLPEKPEGEDYNRDIYKIYVTTRIDEGTDNPPTYAAILLSKEQVERYVLSGRLSIDKADIRINNSTYVTKTLGTIDDYAYFITTPYIILLSHNTGTSHSYYNDQEKKYYDTALDMVGGYYNYTATHYDIVGDIAYYKNYAVQINGETVPILGNYYNGNNLEARNNFIKIFGRALPQDKVAFLFKSVGHWPGDPYYDFEGKENDLVLFYLPAGD